MNKYRAKSQARAYTIITERVIYRCKNSRKKRRKHKMYLNIYFNLVATVCTALNFCLVLYYYITAIRSINL